MAQQCKNGALVLRTHKGYRMGRSHQNSKLNEQVVRNLRFKHEMLEMGYRTLAKEIDVHWSTVRDVCIYRTWVHVH